VRIAEECIDPYTVFAGFKIFESELVDVGTAVVFKTENAVLLHPLTWMYWMAAEGPLSQLEVAETYFLDQAHFKLDRAIRRLYA
jgi:hypothetical protein